MRAEQLDFFKKILLDKREELLREADKTIDHMQTDSWTFADPADRATHEEAFGAELRTRDRERKLIRKIDVALRSIERGDYGVCEACGGKIGIARLKARPTAMLCTDCKDLAEQQEHRIM